jgi:hypothetical protein
MTNWPLCDLQTGQIHGWAMPSRGDAYMRVGPYRTPIRALLLLPASFRFCDPGTNPNASYIACFVEPSSPAREQLWQEESDAPPASVPQMEPQNSPQKSSTILPDESEADQRSA